MYASLIKASLFETFRCLLNNIIEHYFACVLCPQQSSFKVWEKIKCFANVVMLFMLLFSVMVFRMNRLGIFSPIANMFFVLFLSRLLYTTDTSGSCIRLTFELMTRLTGLIFSSYNDTSQVLGRPRVLLPGYCKMCFVFFNVCVEGHISRQCSKS